MEIQNKVNLKKKNKFLKYVNRILIIFLSILIIGYLYQKVGMYFDSKKYSYPGQIVSVNGHNMHIFSEGKGNETIVFASGNGVSCPYVNFYPLYKDLIKYSRIAVYDRPGTGWSESTKMSRNIDVIAEEIHSSLVKSGQKPPYIFVSHSLGSLETIRFAQKYKNEVKGIIFIDSGNPEFYKNYPLSSSSYITTKLLKNFGILRLMFMVTDTYKKMSMDKNGMNLVPVGLQNMDKAMMLKNIANNDGINELKNAAANAEIVLKNGKLGSIPIRIFTSQSNSTMFPEWGRSQIDFKNWSTDSKQMIVNGSRHYIHLYDPNIIDKSIIELIQSK